MIWHHSDNPRLKEDSYWITPPEIYKTLNEEFCFDYDPCPYPLPENFNGLNVDWGEVNYVNPPFHRYGGIGPTAFVRKGISENARGKTVVIVLPTASYVNLLLEAGAEIRPLGRVRWLHTETRKPMKNPSQITCFVLRGDRS
jgi:hypothetical protein